MKNLLFKQKLADKAVAACHSSDVIVKPVLFGGDGRRYTINSR